MACVGGVFAESLWRRGSASARWESRPARTHHLSTCDAPSLDLAMRLGLPIATQDAPLVKAAKTCRVPAFSPASAQS